MGLGEVSVQEFGKNTDVLLRVQKQEGGNKEQVEALNKIKNFYRCNFYRCDFYSCIELLFSDE